MSAKSQTAKRFWAGLVIGVLMVSLMTLLSGCDLPPLPTLAIAPSTYHDVRYYDVHPIERSQTNAWCGDNPGLATKVPSCDSADTSGIHAWHRKMGFE